MFGPFSIFWEPFEIFEGHIILPLVKHNPEPYTHPLQKLNLSQYLRIEAGRKMVVLFFSSSHLTNINHFVDFFQNYMLFPDNNRENKCKKIVIKSICHLDSCAQHEWALLPIHEATGPIEILQSLSLECRVCT